MLLGLDCIKRAIYFGDTSQIKDTGRIEYLDVPAFRSLQKFSIIAYIDTRRDLYGVLFLVV